MRLMILGAPGAGKGTQSEFLSDRFSIPIIGTGNLIRDAVKQNGPQSKEIAEAIDAGKLVPDEIVLKLIKDRMSQGDVSNGYILDGFPRNVAQAEALEGLGIHLDHVVSIELPDEEILKRLAGRRVCGKCGSSYHIENKKPCVENKCDRCGGDLIIRKDDAPEIAKGRLEIYYKQTAPLKDYYAKIGKLRTIKSQGDVHNMHRLILAALEE